MRRTGLGWGAICIALSGGLLGSVAAEDCAVENGQSRWTGCGEWGRSTGAYSGSGIQGQINHAAKAALAPVPHVGTTISHDVGLERPQVTSKARRGGWCWRNRPEGLGASRPNALDSRPAEGCRGAQVFRCMPARGDSM